MLDAAQQLGYTPYGPARALRSGRSDVILFLIPEWPIGAAIARLVEELSLSLAGQGLTLVVHAHPRSARPVEELWKAIAPAAVINHQALHDDELQAAHRAGIPVVEPVFQLDRAGTFADFQRAIGRTQAEHLIATGHRRIGFALPDDDRLLAFVEPRVDGVRAACAHGGIDQPVTRTVGLDVAVAQRAVTAWNRARPKVTGICAYNDEVALAVLAGMRARKLTAPADLAVVGVDDTPAAGLTHPALTSVATGMSEIGRHLAASVAHTLKGDAAPPGAGPDLIRLVRRDSAP